MEAPESMEAGSGTAAAPPGSGPAAAEGIDLSLDDIIKRNKKGQTAQKDRRWRQPRSSKTPAYNSGRPRFRNWGPRNLQGPNRFRGGFMKQQLYRKPFWNGATRPGQKGPDGPTGKSPLNRPPPAQQNKPEETAAGRSDGVDGAMGRPSQPPAPRVKPFRNAGVPWPAQRNRPFQKRAPFFQRQSRFNFHQRQQAAVNADGKPRRIRRWQPQSNLGAVMTVSVSNLQASQANLPGRTRRPFPRGRNFSTRPPIHQPKGVPLRFNFHAMANQTSLTLNERFSGLWNKRRFTAFQKTSRMVTLP